MKSQQEIIFKRKNQGKPDLYKPKRRRTLSQSVSQKPSQKGVLQPTSLKRVAQYLSPHISLFDLISLIPQRTFEDKGNGFWLLYLAKNKILSIPHTLVQDAKALNNIDYRNIALEMASQNGSMTSLYTFCADRQSNPVAKLILQHIRSAHDVPAWLMPAFRIQRPDIRQALSVLWPVVISQAKSWARLQKIGEVGLRLPWHVTFENGKKIQGLLRTLSCPCVKATRQDAASIIVGHRLLIRLAERDKVLLFLLLLLPMYNSIGKDVEQIHKANLLLYTEEKTAASAGSISTSSSNV